jgi:hypothetical protein
MIFDPQAMPKVLRLYLEISQYPILAKRIRHRMRDEMFGRGVISPQVFEQEVTDKAIRSQELEGMTNPLEEEPPDVWLERTEHIRDYLTDFYFAYNLPHDLFEQLVQEVITAQAPTHEVILSFNPELAPWDMLFAQGEAYENAPPEERAQFQHHLREIIVVLVKAMISDQLAFLRVARDYITIADLQWIRAHRIGRGKIGGKAAGMLLAHKILQHKGRELGIEALCDIAIPESWYLASDVFYDFHANNDLFYIMNQKYKAHEQMIADYPRAYKAYLSSHLPEQVQAQLLRLLEEVGNEPLIVRSSSLLEDNMDTSFAGKYDSFFLANQGTLEENLHALITGIIKVYAGVIRPEALIYREQMGLTDYDERMAVLIQKVEGQRYGRYFFPSLSGVGFSHNPYRWSKRIRREDGLLRIVAGLGTRAVERVSQDYPRMVALSHPELRPERGAGMLRRYSQHQIDVIDLEANALVTLPVTEVMDIGYPGLGAIISVDQGGFIQPLSGRPLSLSPDQMVVTFDSLLAREEFVGVMREMLVVLEEAYKRPVDIEFAVEVTKTYPRPELDIVLLQCRSLSQRRGGQVGEWPSDVPEEDILFTAADQVPDGAVTGIRYIVYVDPHVYARIPDPSTRIQLGQVIGRINQALGEDCFILMGPGRWGTSNIQLGVKVTYADIYNTKVLIEVAHADGGSIPEVSYGTHFFQDLVEANIYPLPIYPDDPAVIYRENFLLESPNVLPDILPGDGQYQSYVKVIDVQAVTGRLLHVVMDAEQDKAIAYFKDDAKCG